MNYLDKAKAAIMYALEDNFSNYYKQDQVTKRIKEAKNVCIFGLGEYFNDCAGHVTSRFDVNLVSDNNPNTWGKTFKGLKCVAPNELIKIEDLVVIIMVGDYKPIAEQLTGLGVENYPSGDIFLNVFDSHYDNAWFKNNEDSIYEALNILSDDDSKEVFVEVLCNRIAPKLAKKTFNELKIPGEYFNHNIFGFSDNEYFVDAGAFVGDSILKFIERVEGRFGEIYSFEMDRFNFERLAEAVKKLNRSDISIFNIGVWNENKEISYLGEREGSFIDANGSNTAKVGRLDDILAGKKVTFIKMDVEGAEIAAIEGASNIIKSQKPKLAISAYHKLSDLWEVPLLIKELRGDYNIYLRHHAPVVWDTDCYAY
ncbi:MAG: FkbM family methyltransferase [Clostridiales bacterium]|nr:FkbM family methyltransferase [Clostridiales bacterium]